MFLCSAGAGSLIIERQLIDFVGYRSGGPCFSSDFGGVDVQGVTISRATRWLRRLHFRASGAECLMLSLWCHSGKRNAFGHQRLNFLWCSSKQPSSTPSSTRRIQAAKLLATRLQAASKAAGCKAAPVPPPGPRQKQNKTKHKNKTTKQKHKHNNTKQLNKGYINRRMPGA